MAGTRTEVIRVGEVAWTVEARRRGILARELLPRVPGLAEGPGVSLVKQSLQRTVHRVDLGDGSSVIVKAYRLRRWKDRAKRAVFGSKARIEWGVSRRLLELGVPASHAIALGEPVGRPGGVEGYLVVEVSPDVASLTARLAEAGALPPGEGAARAAALLREVGGFVRTLHDAGVRHHDLHTGNILVRACAPPGEGRCLIIDLHRVGVGHRPGARHRARAIAQLVQSIPREPGEGVEAAVEALLSGYNAAGGPAGGVRAERIVRLAGLRGAQRLRSRARRCLKESSAFTVERLPRWRIYRRRDFAASKVLEAIARHGEQGAATREQDGALVSRVACEGGRVLEVREYRAGPLAGAWRLVRRSPGVAAYAATHRAWLVARSGRRAVAAAEVLRGEGRGRSFAIIEVEAGAGGEG